MSLKIDKKLSEDVEKYWRLNLYQDKTSLVRDALEFYIHAVKCEHCGAMNPRGANYCALCNSVLRDYKVALEELEKVISDFKEIIQIYVMDSMDVDKKFKYIKAKFLQSYPEGADSFDSNFQDILKLLNHCETLIKNAKSFFPNSADAKTYQKYCGLGEDLLKDPTNNGYVIHECIINIKSYIALIDSQLRDIDTIKTIVMFVEQEIKRNEANLSNKK